MRALSLAALLLLASCASSSSPATIGPDRDDDGGIHADADTDTPLPDGGGSTPGETTNGSRLKAIVITGEDGSKMTLAGTWRDTQLNTDCTFGKAGDGQLRCIPSTPAALSAVSAYYSDAACSRVLAYIIRGACFTEEPRFAYINPAETCRQGQRFAPITGPYAAGTLYTKSSTDSCYATDGNARLTYDFYSTGAESAPASFVAVTRQ